MKYILHIVMATIHGHCGTMKARFVVQGSSQPLQNWHLQKKKEKANKAKKESERNRGKAGGNGLHSLDVKYSGVVSKSAPLWICVYHQNSWGFKSNIFSTRSVSNRTYLLINTTISWNWQVNLLNPWPAIFWPCICAGWAHCVQLLSLTLFCCLYSTVLVLLPTYTCLTHTHRSVEPPQLASRHVAWPQLLKCQGSQVAFQHMECVCWGVGKVLLSVCIHMALTWQQTQPRGGAGAESWPGVCRGHDRSEVSETDKGQWLHLGH